MNPPSARALRDALKNCHLTKLEINYAMKILGLYEVPLIAIIHLTPTTNCGKLSFIFRQQCIAAIKARDEQKMVQLFINIDNFWPELKAEGLTISEIKKLTCMEQEEVHLLTEILKMELAGPIFLTFRSPRSAGIDAAETCIRDIKKLETEYIEYPEFEIINHSYRGFEQILNMGLSDKLPNELSQRYSTEIKLYQYYCDIKMSTDEITSINYI